jgi:hypothetical protein
MIEFNSDHNGTAQNAKQCLITDLATSRFRDAAARYFNAERPFAGADVF